MLPATARSAPTRASLALVVSLSGLAARFARAEGEPSAAIAEEDEIIILEDEGEGSPDEPNPPSVTGALGRLWETWHVAADSDLLGAVQAVEPEDGPWRLLGNVWLESWLLPAPNLGFYANGFARAAIDGTPTGRLTPFVDAYEAFAKINVDRAVVSVGRLVVPWGRAQGAALGDRLNAPDFRRGPPFPDPARQKQPMWGGLLRTSVGSLGVEAVAFAKYENSEGSLAASNQGGVRIGRYQTALVRSPSSTGGLLEEEDTSPLREEPVLASSGVIAGRVWRRVGDFDVGGSVVWGFDETPSLRLRPDVARALAAEVVALRAGPVEDVTLACGGDRSLACVGGAGAIVQERTTSFAVDASWGLGLVILRAEAVAYPDVDALGGKAAIVADDLGLRSIRVSQYAGVLAAEGAIGSGLEGSLEVFDVIWDSIPADAVLWGVEPFAEDTAARRVVHRAAVATSLGGAFFEERLSWRLRGEAGLLAPDVLASGELRYRVPFLGMYVGGRADIFTGVKGTPGWFREQGTLLGVFVGEGG